MIWNDGHAQITGNTDCYYRICLKLDSILIIVVAAVVTAIVSGLGVEGLLETFGESFVSNRSMAIFILIMLVTGTLERNGLKNAAAALIGRFKRASAAWLSGLMGS